MNSTKENTILDDSINHTVVFANMLSGASASPLVSKTIARCGSYAPVIAMKEMLDFLTMIEAPSVAFDLTLVWFNLVEGAVPEVLISIDPDSELASIFVNELLLDLDDIINEELVEDLDEDQ